MTTRSAEECEMSRSCQSATFSSPTSACARTTRASPQTRSDTTGFRLCGIADEPFWPLPNGSATSATSVRARCPISASIELEDPAGQLQPERGRLRVHAVRASHADRGAVLERAPADRLERSLDPLEEQRSGLADLE